MSYVLLRNLKRDTDTKTELTFLALPRTAYGKHVLSFSLYKQDTTLTPAPGSSYFIAANTFKWSFKVQTWPFFKVNNLLRLVTRLFSNDSSVLAITDDPQNTDPNVARLLLQTRNTYISLGMLNFITLDTTNRVSMVAAYGKEPGRGPEFLTFIIPQFLRTAVYDPNLGVIIQGDEDNERSDGGDGTTVAIGVGVAVPVAVGVPFVVIVSVLAVLAYKKRAALAAIQSRMSRVYSFDAASVTPA